MKEVTKTEEVKNVGELNLLDANNKIRETETETRGGSSTRIAGAGEARRWRGEVKEVNKVTKVHQVKKSK